MRRPFAIVSDCERPAVSDELWSGIRREAARAAAQDPLLAQAIERAVLRRASLGDALCHLLARKLADPELDASSITMLVGDAIEDDPEIAASAATDLCAIRERDPACPDLLTPFLFFKGYQALQAYRVSHWLWHHGRHHLANLMQSRISEVFAV